MNHTAFLSFSLAERSSPLTNLFVTIKHYNDFKAHGENQFTVNVRQSCQLTF